MHEDAISRFYSPEINKERRRKILEKFSQLLESLKNKDGQLNTEALWEEGLEGNTFTKDDLDEKTRKLLLNIAEQNWEAQKPEVAKQIQKSINTSLSSPSSDIYVFTFDEEPIAFLAVKSGVNSGSSTLEVNSFNIAPEIKSRGFGRAMADIISEREGFDKLIANVFLDFPVGSMYIEECGFAIYGVEEFAGKNGEIYERLLLERDEWRDYVQDTELEKFDLSTQRDLFKKRIIEERNNGRFGVRYLLDPADPNIRYIAFGHKEMAEFDDEY